MDVDAEDKAIGDGEQFFKLAAWWGAGPITCCNKRGPKAKQNTNECGSE